MNLLIFLGCAERQVRPVALLSDQRGAKLFLSKYFQTHFAYIPTHQHLSVDNNATMSAMDLDAPVSIAPQPGGTQTSAT
jgi:hypothetical protein